MLRCPDLLLKLDFITFTKFEQQANLGKQQVKSYSQVLTFYYDIVFMSSPLILGAEPLSHEQMFSFRSCLPCENQTNAAVFLNTLVPYLNDDVLTVLERKT